MSNLINRLMELSGLEPVAAAPLAEAIADAAFDNSVKDYEAPGKLFGLYVGLRGSGKLNLEFTGDKADCLSQWHDDLKNSYKRGEAVARVVPVYNDSPQVIAEATEETDVAFLESEIIEFTAEEEAERVIAETAAAELIAIAKARTEEVVEPIVEADAVAVAKLDLTPNEEVDGVAVVDDSEKLAVPSDVKSQLSQRIAELKKAIEKYDNKGYNDEGGVKVRTVLAMEQILALLNKGTTDSYVSAQILMGTLMSPMTGMFPPKVINFLASAKPIEQTGFKAVKESCLTEATNIQERDFYEEVLKHFPGATRERGKGGGAGITLYYHEGQNVGYHDAYLGIGGHTAEDKPGAVPPENLT